MRHQASLRRLVIIWSHQQNPVSTRIGSTFRRLNGFVCGVGAGTRQNVGLPFGSLDRARDQCQRLVIRQCRRFAGGAYRNKPFYTGRKLAINQRIKSGPINFATIGKGRYQRCKTPSNLDELRIGFPV